MHLTESELLALVHGESTPVNAAEQRLHLAACHPCRAAYDEVSQLNAEVASRLALLQEPLPDLSLDTVRRRARSRPSWGALAAGLTALVLAAGAVAASVPGSPLHSWVQSVMGRARSPQAAAVSRAPVGSPADLAAGVRVVPGKRLTVALLHPQTHGEIRLGLDEGAVATVRAVGGDVGYIVASDRITLDNRRPAVRYEVTAPRGTAEITLLVGDRVLWRGPDTAAASTTIDLSVGSQP